MTTFEDPMLLPEELDDEAFIDGETETVDGLAHYLHEIGQFQFLSREEEIALSRGVLAGRRAASRLANRSDLTPAEEGQLQATIAAARAAADRLGIWCGLPAERPAGLTAEAAFAEDLRLANLIQAGHLARVALAQDPNLPPAAVATAEAQIATAQRASEVLGLAWSKAHRATAQLAACGLSAEEQAATQALFTAAQAAYRRLEHRPARDAAERAALARLVKEGEACRNTLVERNLRLVVNMAKRYTRLGLDLDDLTSCGNFGLIEGAEKYDWRRGTRFTTYVSLCIKQYLSRGLSDTSRVVRVPTYRVDDARKLSRLVPDLAQHLGRTPSTAEIAVAAQVPVSEVQQLLELTQAPASLDQTVSDDDGDLTLGGAIPDPAADVSDAAAAIADLRHILKAAFQDAGLDRRQLEIFHQRFELDLTYDAIAAAHGLTRERVRQILAEVRLRLLNAIDPTLVADYLPTRLAGRDGKGSFAVA